jgi:hypothetical protein
VIKFANEITPEMSVGLLIYKGAMTLKMMSDKTFYYGGHTNKETEIAVWNALSRRFEYVSDGLYKAAEHFEISDSEAVFTPIRKANPKEIADSYWELLTDKKFLHEKAVA